MEIKVYDELPDSAIDIRKEVFMEEQGFKNEFDEKDKVAKHFVAYKKDKPVATCRIYSSDDDAYIFGRLAVRKEYRGKRIGEQILMSAEKFIKDTGGKKCILCAQTQASDFYRKQGYKEYGDITMDEFCPHIMMEKRFEE